MWEKIGGIIGFLVVLVVLGVGLYIFYQVMMGWEA